MPGVSGITDFNRVSFSLGREYEFRRVLNGTSRVDSGSRRDFNSGQRVADVELANQSVRAGKAATNSTTRRRFHVPLISSFFRSFRLTKLLIKK